MLEDCSRIAVEARCSTSPPMAVFHFVRCLAGLGIAILEMATAGLAFFRMARRRPVANASHGPGIARTSGSA
jgi:hypothetical protein